jgi:hypothetical protein
MDSKNCYIYFTLLYISITVALLCQHTKETKLMEGCAQMADLGLLSKQSVQTTSPLSWSGVNSAITAATEDEIPTAMSEYMRDIPHWVILVVHG